MSALPLLLAVGCIRAAPPHEAPAAALETFPARTHTVHDGTEVPVPGSRTLVIEVIRSADW